MRDVMLKVAKYEWKISFLAAEWQKSQIARHLRKSTLYLGLKGKKVYNNNISIEF